LERLYATPGEAGSFSSPAKLLRAAQQEDPSIKLTVKNVTDFLKEKPSYYLYRPVRVHFKRNRYIVSTFGEVLAVDLMDVSNMAGANNGYTFIFVGIDAFSRFAHAVPLKTKKCADSVAAFRKVFAKKFYRSVYADKGGEFRCKAVREFLSGKKSGIFFSENYVKVAIVERFIQTLRTKIARYMEEKNTSKYIDSLQDIILSYNKTYHRTIGTSPISVTEKNSLEVFHTQYLPLKTSKTRKRLGAGSGARPQFQHKIGDFVRVSQIKRSPYSKESTRQKWTEEVFKIVKRLSRDSVAVYELEDSAGEKIKGKWYHPELFSARFNPEEDTYKLDPNFKIRSKTVRGKKYFFVKYLGWPDKFNQWVPEENLEDLKSN